MHWIDITLLIPLLLALWRGFRRGLVLELSTLIGLFLGIFAGIRFSSYAADILQSKLEIESAHLPILSFAVTFLAVVIAVFILGKVLERIIKIMALSLLNKLAGALFSLSKVALILAIILVLFSRFNADFEWVDQTQLSQSVSYTVLSELGELILPEFEKAMEDSAISI